MYIWVVLATFLAMLYSYNLSPRADIREIEKEPIVRAVISKLVLKQQAAALYMRENTPPYAHTTDPFGHVYETDNVTYSAGVLSSDMLKAYYPYGFKDDGSVNAEIYCLDKNNLSQEKACSDENAARYLVLYMIIANRWLNVRTGLPNNDFTNAMKQVVPNDDNFGYPRCQKYVTDPETGKEVCKKYAVRSREAVHSAAHDDPDSTLGFELPEYIVKHGEYSKSCGSNSRSGTKCLIYIQEYQAAYGS